MDRRSIACADTYPPALRLVGSSRVYHARDALHDAPRWCTLGPSGQARYTDPTIQISLMLRTAFKLALRQTEGLMTSVLTLMDPPRSAVGLRRYR
jgi:Transposase DDE domain